MLAIRRSQYVDVPQDSRIFIELINAPFLYDHKGSPAEYKTGLKVRELFAAGYRLHESGTYEIHPGGCQCTASTESAISTRLRASA